MDNESHTLPVDTADRIKIFGNVCKKTLEFITSPKISAANDHLKGKNNSRDLMNCWTLDRTLLYGMITKLINSKDAVAKFAVKPEISLESVVSYDFRQILAVISSHTPLPSLPNTVKQWIV